MPPWDIKYAPHRCMPGETKVYGGVNLRRAILILLSIILLTLTACSEEVKEPIISEPVVCKSIDKKTSRPIEASSQFIQSDLAIYFTVKIQDLPRDTTLKAIWKYLDDNTEVSTEITTEGTGYEVFTLKRSGSQFPAGKYEVTVNCEAGEKKLSASGKFSITAEVKPVHLLNPITAKGVDSEDKLNPVDITSEFYPSDPLVYFIVQSKDLPQNTRVSCTWYYADTGDILSHQLNTDGNRNIAFTLKPEEGKTLPIGKYIVTATVKVNDETESISKEFEIREK